ncbi:hypothetical protein CHS0354_029897 [Potamilus streckersoni]|uniref:VWFA domain-containing protein n=1 Tax=Potamilus streckersoni TaxID=2493646 RepID=A0AAE0RSZ2_9BIVA|nr:hypothetical protein CHS0354_029897 [Potamilus streckersoni]
MKLSGSERVNGFQLQNNCAATNRRKVDSQVKGIIMNRTMVTFLWLATLVYDSKAETCGRIADVVFVIDSSSSIWEPYFVQQLEFVKQLVKAFDVGQDKTRIGALTFSNKTITEFHLNTYDNKQDVLDAISAIKFAQGDETNTYDALMVLRSDFFSERNGDRSDVPNIAIVLTDGESSDEASTAQEAKLTRKAGVAIFAIGIGDAVNKVELEEIASSPKSDYMHTLVNFNELQSDTFTKLLSHKVCTEECQGQPVDILFVLDVSTSILLPGFQAQMHFVKGMVDNFDIDSGKIQVGIITFSNSAQTEFRLGQHKTKKDTMAAIDRVKFRAGATNTSYALSVLLEQFQQGSGSRQGVDHIAFVITDGHSNNPEATRKMAILVHKNGIEVFAIGVGNSYKIQELQAIASKPSDKHVYQVSDYKALSSIKNSLASKVCKS